MELCLQYISSLKLPQREALMNIGPINASIWSNLNVLKTMIKWPLHVEFSVAIFSWSSGHLKLPKQKALTKHNRLVSAIVRVSMVTVVAAENLVHFEDWNSEALVESNLQAETPGACCMLLGWAYLSSLVCSTHYKLLHAPLALLCSLPLGYF